ncbi:MAG: signal peptidase I [Clostridia bacterium]|nr:signal peptidase I [Clostridia bacterium]
MEKQKDTKKFDISEFSDEEESYETLNELEEWEFEELIRDGVEVEEKTSFWQEVFEWSKSIAIAVVLALIINQFFFAMVQVEGESMLPTLQSKDRLVVTKLFYQPKAKDIVVIKSHALGKHIIKRVIAMPGDTIDIHQETGDVLINGEVINEPYIKEKLLNAGNAQKYPLVVPENYVFVMGDNRNNSQDSRNLGLIAFEDIVGRASLRVMPFSQFGGLYENLEP